MQDRRKVLELFEQNKDFLKQKIDSGIEKYRKGTANLTIKDKDGNLLKNASVSINQKSHKFKFGANLFLLDEMETSEKNEKYKECFKELFNIGTIPFYWSGLEPEKGKTRYQKTSPKVYRRPSPDLCLEFCEQNGIEPREHALAYEHTFPEWLKNASVAEVKEELERRYKEISDRYADKINCIEITNEMNWPSGKTSFFDEPDFIEWCFRMGEKYFPNNQLVINEEVQTAFGGFPRATDRYSSYIEANLLKGVKIDAIGLQYHMFFKSENEYEATRLYYDPVRLYKFLDLYARFNLPLQITEITIPSYSNNDEDEKLQAEIIEILYSIWFSHPNMEQIIYWNIVDGYCHCPSQNPDEIKATQGNMTLGENYYYGGLLRFDMTPKPAYYTIKNLICEKWHTSLDVKTNESGSTSFRGFLGTYDIEIKIGDKTITRQINLENNESCDFIIEI